MKQFQGEYMGSMLTGLFESLGRSILPDSGGDDVVLDDEVFDRGLSNTVKDNDSRFPPDFRLSKSGRRKPE
jgi:enoyl-CoA hydratase